MVRARRAVGPALFVAAMVMAMAGQPAVAGTVSGLKPTQMFDLASQAEQKQDTALAVQIYKALANDPSLDVRNEARFRHAKLMVRDRRLNEAAVLYRAILDEKPDAQRVRLELAGVLAQMGEVGRARRELRQAQAGGLPPDVAHVVDQFQAALRSYKPLGGSFELGLAPSTNINRATSANTINTVIAPLELSQDARASSGVGFNVSGQLYGQVPLSPKVRLTARVSTQNQLYRLGAFNDDSFAGEIGADVTLGKSRLRLTGGPSIRLYGGRAYSHATNASLNWLRPVSRTAQVEVEGDVSLTDYTQNPLQTGPGFVGSLAYEQAFSPRFGGRLTLFGQRQSARDPGYATSSGGASLLAYREMGKVTLYTSVAVSHLEGDGRLFLFPDRRVEWLYRANVGATFRQIKVHGFSPVLRLSYEYNRSSVDIYDYRRFGGEVAMTRAF